MILYFISYKQSIQNTRLYIATNDIATYVQIGSYVICALCMDLKKVCGFEMHT